MKTVISVAFIIGNLLTSIAQTDSILFLGNSYTYTADVPGTFKSLAISGGKSVYIDSYAPGGKQLSQHYVDPTSQAKIASHQWDYVVLQEQSQMPLISQSTTSNNASAIIRDFIKPNNNCTEPIIYMTWAREEGNSWLVSTGYSHNQMADIYEGFYEDLWKNMPGRISAVGAAFHEATKQGIDIYSNDGSHQNSDGSYLAACVFYATIYKESPIGLSYSSASSETIKNKLQQIANDVVINHLYDYNINKVKFDISTSEINAGDAVDFSEQVYIHNYPPIFKWTFEGSATTSSASENPSNIIYDTDGVYDVTLEIATSCFTETRKMTDTIKVGEITALDDITIKANHLYPTLSSVEGKIHLSQKPKLNEWQLFNALGSKTPFSFGYENELIFRKTTGMYYLRNTKTGKLLKFIIE